MRLLANLTWIEFKLFLREPFAVIFTFVFPLVTLVVISGSFAADDPAFRGATPSDYYLASYIGVVIGAVGLIAVPAHGAAYVERGILRRFQASAIPAWSVFCAQLLVGLIMVVSGSVALLVAGRLLYGAHLPLQRAGALLAFGVSALSFLVMGLLVALLTRNARAAQAIGMLLFFPMFLLSGAGPPRSVMSSPMQAVSKVLPLTFVVRALQDPWLGKGQNVLNLLLLALVCLAALLIARRLTVTRA